MRLGERRLVVGSIHEEVGGVMRKRLRSWLSVASVAALAITPIATRQRRRDAGRRHRPSPVACGEALQQARRLPARAQPRDRLRVRERHVHRGRELGQGVRPLRRARRAVDAVQFERARVRQPHELQHHAAQGPVGDRPERPGQVVPVRAQRSRVAGHGHLRHAVLPGAGEHLPAGQQQEHPRPRGLAQARGPGLHGDAVLPARLDSVADLAGRRRAPARATRPCGARR